VKRSISFLFLMLLATALQANEPRVTGLPDFTGLVESAGPAVVNIRVTQFGNRARSADRREQQPDNEDIPEFFRRFFDVPQDPRFGRPDRLGAGSGFIYDASGYIITNHHVIEDADQIIVRLADRREFEAELIGSDPASDVALLKIDAQDLPVLEFGNSEELRPGEWVAAIGSPFNFEQSVTAGIVSAKGRSNASQQYVPFIQTDVAINRGNSGGPLLDSSGRLIGVNTAIVSPSGAYSGVGFAVPVDVVRDVVPQLIAHGGVSRPGLGVKLLSDRLGRYIGLSGVGIAEVVDGGAAERAGLHSARQYRDGTVSVDEILAVNGRSVATGVDLLDALDGLDVGDSVSLSVRRGQEVTTVSLRLQAID